MSHRTFIAVDLPAEVQRELMRVRRHLDDGRSKINWVAEENLHVTMQFLGDLSDKQLAAVCTAVEKVAAELPPLEFALDAITAVPNNPRRGPLRMAWASVNDSNEHLAYAYEAVQEVLTSMGFASDSRPYTPHVTLARVKFVRDDDYWRQEIAQQHAPAQPIVVDYLTVYTSELTPKGPVYTAAVMAKCGE